MGSQLIANKEFAAKIFEMSKLRSGALFEAPGKGLRAAVSLHL